MKPKDILKDLIKIESYSGNEKNKAEYIFNFAKQNGLDVEMQDGNVVIKLINNSENCIIFNGHMDTVKPGDLNSWKSNPFELTEVEDKLIGLGASDMQGALAVFLDLAIDLKNMNFENTDVIFTFVTMEEVDGSGTESFVKYFTENYDYDAENCFVVLGEPTNLTSISIGHKGNIFLEIITEGDTGHGARPYEIKKNAISEMQKIIQQMFKIEKDLKSKFKSNIFGETTFGLTGISANSETPNKFSSKCKTIWDIRTIPESHNEIIEILKTELDAEVKVIGQNSFSYTSPDNKFLKKLQKVTGTNKLVVSKGANDGTFFTEIGNGAVEFGPGIKSVIHSENEYIIEDNMNKSKEIYKTFIKSI